MLSSASGELSGISSIRKPDSYSTSQTASISAGVMPRRIAISGHFCNFSAKLIGFSPFSYYRMTRPEPLPFIKLTTSASET